MAEPRAMDETFLPAGARAPAAAPDAVRVGAFEPRSVVAGPGERAVIWVTGCLRRCPGCMKPEWFGFDTGVRTPIAELVERVLAVHAQRPLTGITFSGGEPFEQAAPLAKLAAELRRAAGLDVLTYSGYRMAALRAETRFAPLLAETDWLIDGEYRGDRPGPLAWRGSDNQTVYEKAADGEHRAASPQVDASPLREVQVSLTANRLRLSGFPDSTLQRKLQESLARRGIRMISKT